MSAGTYFCLNIFFSPFHKQIKIILSQLGSSNSTGNLATETNLSSTELTIDELTEAFEYVLCKLTKGSQTVNPSCNLRIFYKVGSSPGPNFIQDILSKFSTRNLVTTIIPATHLHNFSTFLSICGIRHE